MIYPTRRSAGLQASLRPWLAIALILILTPMAEGEVKKPRIGKDTPEGTFLELVALEANTTKKIALLEHFLSIFPACDPTITVWVYSDLQERYRKSGDLNKALAAGEKVLALDPDNIEIAEVNRRIAEKKGDAQQANKWSAEIEKMAARIVKLPIPADPEESKAAQERIEYAMQIVTNTDYAEYTKAIGIPGPAERISALETFVKRLPQNQYMDQIEVAEFLAYKELGDLEKTLAAAEKILTHNEGRPDVLLFVVEVDFGRKKDPKRTLSLAAKCIDGMTGMERPEGIGERDWIQVKNKNLARLSYIIGRIHFEAGQWPPADRALRAALPLTSDDQVRAAILYDLAWANYQMRTPNEAIRFYSLCAAIKGPLQEQAAKNILSVKFEYHLQ